jgi:hypothetical protein
MSFSDAAFTVKGTITPMLIAAVAIAGKNSFLIFIILSFSWLKKLK